MSVSFKPRHIPSDVWEARDELSSRHRADSRDARPLAFYPVATIRSVPVGCALALRIDAEDHAAYDGLQQ